MFAPGGCQVDSQRKAEKCSLGKAGGEETGKGYHTLRPSVGEVQVITNQCGLNAKGLKNILSPLKSLGYSHRPKEWSINFSSHE